MISAYDMFYALRRLLETICEETCHCGSREDPDLDLHIEDCPYRQIVEKSGAPKR